MVRNIFASLLCIFLTTTSLTTTVHSAESQDVAVVASKDVANLDKNDVIAVYSGHPTGATSKVHFVDYATDTTARDVFYQAVTGRKGSQMQSFWIQHVFSGAGRGPIFVGSAEEMKSILQTEPKTIGYLLANQVTEDMKVIAVIKPGQKLH